MHTCVCAFVSTCVCKCGVCVQVCKNHAHARARTHQYTGAQAPALRKAAALFKTPRRGRLTDAKTALQQAEAGCRPREMCKLGRSGPVACLKRPSAALSPRNRLATKTGKKSRLKAPDGRKKGAAAGGVGLQASGWV